MKKPLIVLIAFTLFSQSCFCQKDSTTKKEEKIKQFWLVVLKTGPQDKEITDTATRNKIFAGHFGNMERLYNEGILKAAGPFGKNDFTWRGLFILDCKTKEEAENYVKTDPSVAAGIFIVDIVPWYSEASGSFVPGKPKKKE
ncbi:MAG: YciI family protein [Chitinophagaceae bacterium]